MLAQAAVGWGFVDEYHVAISPMVAGHGPNSLAGLPRAIRLTLREAEQLRSGVVIYRYGVGATVHASS